MTDKEFLEHTASGHPVASGSPLHSIMHRLSQEGLRLTTEINSAYHTPKELRTLMSRLTGKPIDEAFGLFPPFYTDCGRNMTFGRRTFINMGCSFQDWGGHRGRRRLPHRTPLHDLHRQSL